MNMFARASGLAAALLMSSCASCPNGNETAEDLTYWKLRNIRQVIEEYRDRHGRLPASLDEVCPPHAPCPATAPGDELVDGWGRHIVYDLADTGYVLRSSGRDGRPGSDDDVVFSSLREAEYVVHIAGCYAVEFEWWPEFPGTTLVLDSVQSTLGYYRLRPVPTGYLDGFWRLRDDTVTALWPLGEMVSELALVAGASGLEGKAAIVGHDERRITARKVACP